MADNKERLVVTLSNGVKLDQTIESGSYVMPLDARIAAIQVIAKDHHNGSTILAMAYGIAADIAYPNE